MGVLQEMVYQGRGDVVGDVCNDFVGCFWWNEVEGVFVYYFDVFV